VQTEGWAPVDARLRVSDVPRLVKMFGGERLYDNNSQIAIRELVQNAADAIRARRKLDPSFSNHADGEIVIRLAEYHDGHYLEIEDNGVGMSERTITGTLLDFGRSFWGTDDVRSEFPGLMAKGMSATGKFGIGFFSVFMLGNVVRVTSRRFDSASSDARTLEFRGGLSLRPILIKPSPGQGVHGGGTKVSVLLRFSPYEKNGLLFQEEDFNGEPGKQDLVKIVATMCPSLDVAVFVELKGRKVKVIRPDDWLRVKGSTLLVRANPSRDAESMSTYGANLRLIRSGKITYGRACIRADQSWDPQGVMTVGGFSSMKLEYIEGILLGTTEVLARNIASLTAPSSALAQWAEKQAEIIAHSEIPLDEQLTAAGVVIACGGSPGKLPVARIGGRYLNQAQLEELVRGRSEISIFHGEPAFEEDLDDCHPREFKTSFKASPHVMFLGEILGATYKSFWWPGKPSYLSILRSVLERRWKSYEEEETEKVIGNVQGINIRREVAVYTRLRR
jgi:hypothetical protein